MTTTELGKKFVNAINRFPITKLYPSEAMTLLQEIGELEKKYRESVLKNKDAPNMMNILTTQKQRLLSKLHVGGIYISSTKDLFNFYKKFSKSSVNNLLFNSSVADIPKIQKLIPYYVMILDGYEGDCPYMDGRKSIADKFRYNGIIPKIFFNDPVVQGKFKKLMNMKNIEYRVYPLIESTDMFMYSPGTNTMNKPVRMVAHSDGYKYIYKTPSEFNQMSPQEKFSISISKCQEEDEEWKEGCGESFTHYDIRQYNDNNTDWEEFLKILSPPDDEEFKQYIKDNFYTFEFFDSEYCNKDTIDQVEDVLKQLTKILKKNKISLTQFNDWKQAASNLQSYYAKQLYSSPLVTKIRQHSPGLKQLRSSVERIRQRSPGFKQLRSSPLVNKIRQRSPDIRDGLKQLRSSMGRRMRSPTV